jgi:hypothetical protein
MGPPSSHKSSGTPQPQCSVISFRSAGIEASAFGSEIHAWTGIDHNFEQFCQPPLISDN